MTKCTFHFYGSSGDVQKFDTLCILPLNVLNEKIYILLWFWFMTLAFLSALVLVYRIATITTPKLRYFITSRVARTTDKYTVEMIIENIGVSDWFLIHQLSKNIDSLHFRDVLVEISHMLKSDRNGNGKPLLSPSADDSTKMEFVTTSQD